MRSASNRDYWERKIIDWENSWQHAGTSSPVERFAALFRKPLEARSAVALKLLAGVRDAHLLELGCGSGFFAMRLLSEGIAKRITGIDLAPRAIERARAVAARDGLADRAEFLEGDILAMELPAADVTIGLGLLDYLSLAQIRDLLGRLPAERYLFSFSERVPTVRRWLHHLYMASQRCPQHYYFSERELLGAFGSRGDPVVVRHRSLSFGAFVHTLS